MNDAIWNLGLTMRWQDDEIIQREMMEAVMCVFSVTPVMEYGQKAIKYHESHVYRRKDYKNWPSRNKIKNSWPSDYQKVGDSLARTQPRKTWKEVFLTF